VAYMLSLACTDRVLVIEVCHIYSGLGPTFTVELGSSFTVGLHRRITLDTFGYLLCRDGALAQMCPNQDNDYLKVLYI
jgi:hypothetical protein